MTAREKAEYLVNKFMSIRHDAYSHAGFLLSSHELSYTTSIMCAEIFVDEMIIQSQGAKFWKDVKYELSRMEVER